MLRSSLTLAGLVALGAAAQAQQAIPSKVKPVTGTVRDAGVLHYGSNTWTRKASQANIGADIIYNNTFTSGYFSALSGDTFTDEGRIPSSSSPTNLSSRPGCAASYTIDGIQIGYCTDDPAGGAFLMNFYELYTACATTVGSIPTATRTSAGPGAPALGTLACWIVTIDLDVGPATFAMQADGDGTYGGAEGTNRFGWEFASTLPAGGQLATGMLIAGDPGIAQRFDGTVWDSPVNYAEAGTGMGTADQFRVDFGPTAPGCYFFNTNPFASFHLELYADACGALPTGTPFCFGDGSGAACPCVNNGAAGNGCANSLFPGGANIAATGTPSIGADNVVLTTTSVPNSSVLFFQGTIQQSAGAGLGFGDGKRCAGGTILRMGTKTAGTAGGFPTNTAFYPEVGNQSVSVRGQVTAAGTRTYQGWYRNAAAFCTPSTFNLTNGLEIAWTL